MFSTSIFLDPALEILLRTFCESFEMYANIPIM